MISSTIYIYNHFFLDSVQLHLLNIHFVDCCLLCFILFEWYEITNVFSVEIHQHIIEEFKVSAKLQGSLQMETQY